MKEDGRFNLGIRASLQASGKYFARATSGSTSLATSISSSTTDSSLPSLGRVKNAVTVTATDAPYHHTESSSSSGIGNGSNGKAALGTSGSDSIDIGDNGDIGDIRHSILYRPYATMSAVQQEQVLLELGKGRSMSWKIPLFGDFSQLLRTHKDAVKTSHSITEAVFVEYMRKSSVEDSWSAAAFQAICKTESNLSTSIGEKSDADASECTKSLLKAYQNVVEGKGEGEINMNQFLFIVAWCALSTEKVSQTEEDNNKTWMDLRRRVIYQYYSSCNKGLLFDGFSSFLDDCAGLSTTVGGAGGSNTNTKTFATDISLRPPAWHGIYNKAWHAGYNIERKDSFMLRAPATSTALFAFSNRTADESDDDDNRNAAANHSADDLAESLALRNVQLAEKANELEELTLRFMKLEKKHCAVKLELADALTNK